jgi:hypothetical protein
MKFGALLAVLMVLSSIGLVYSQTISVSGTINANTTWNADTVLITGNISVEPNVLLSISPGTYIEAQGYYKIDVMGRIKALGTQTNPIVFRAHDTTSFWQDSTSVQGAWGGINIIGTNTSTDTSVFDYCSIQFGKRLDVYGGNIKGGAINVKDYGAIIIRNSVFKNNIVICYHYGATGGAVYCENVPYVLIEENYFEHNWSFGFGGAVGIGYQCDKTIIKKNMFIGNIAFHSFWASGNLVYTGGGAGISIHDDIGLNPIVSDNEFYNNISVNGMIYTSSLNALIFNNVVCNNSGNGIVDGHQLSTSRIFNNTVANNRVFLGGINLFSSAIVYDNLCWGNREIYYGHMINQINVTDILPVHPQLFNNCIEYGEGGTDAVYDNPEFVYPTTGSGLSYNGYDADWSLPVLSPCINKGKEDTTGLFIPPFDLTGSPRIYPARIDIGAYENNSLWLNAEKENDLNNIQIFPNPGYNQLTISANNLLLNDAQFALVDMQGVLVRSEKLNSESTTLNAEKIKPGFYFYRITDATGKVIERGKWVKE